MCLRAHKQPCLPLPNFMPIAQPRELPPEAEVRYASPQPRPAAKGPAEQPTLERKRWGSALTPVHLQSQRFLPPQSRHAWGTCIAAPAGPGSPERDRTGPLPHPATGRTPGSGPAYPAGTRGCLSARAGTADQTAAPSSSSEKALLARAAHSVTRRPTPPEPNPPHSPARGRSTPCLLSTTSSLRPTWPPQPINLSIARRPPAGLGLAAMATPPVGRAAGSGPARRPSSSNKHVPTLRLVLLATIREQPESSAPARQRHFPPCSQPCPFRQSPPSPAASPDLSSEETWKETYSGSIKNPSNPWPHSVTAWSVLLKVWSYMSYADMNFTPYRSLTT